MRRAVTIYGLVLSAALFGAYRVWTAPGGEAEAGESVTVLAGNADELERVHYRSGKIDLSIEMRKDELGRYGWVRAEPLDSDAAEPEPEPDPANPHAPPPPPKDDGTVQEFKAGKSGGAALEGLLPFKAKRALEGVTDEKLAELGLGEPEATLEIVRAGREPATFEIGGNVYGGANVYVRDPASGKVYVVDAKVIRPLQSGKQSLPDRELVGFETKQIAALAVQGGEASAQFEQHNPDDPEAVFWSTAGDAAKNETAAAWIDKALRMRSSGYVQAGEEPSQLEGMFAFAVTTTDRKLVRVEVLRGYDEDGEELWFAKSEHTRGLVKLQKALAGEVSADLANVLDSGAS
jgi:Domain of unknown function (DUF4340)